MIHLRFWPTVAVLCLVVLTSILGFWQLDRARVKEARLRVINQYQNLPAANLRELMQGGLQAGEELAYRPVQAYGKFLKHHVVFLENRYHKGQPGFHVLMVFAVDGGTHVLVNRGWLARDPAQRQAIADFSSHDRPFCLEGIIHSDAGRTLMLSDRDETGHAIRQNLGVQSYGQERGIALPPFVIAQTGARCYSDGDSGNGNDVTGVQDGLVRDWQPPANDAARHYGYMVQWWAMALVTVLAGLFSAVSRSPRKAP